MNDIELLREAARLMRERAKGVYPEMEWRALVMAHSGTALDHALHWSPAVALAVADWLGTAASGFEYLPPRQRDQQALVVARAYLVVAP